MCPEGGRPDRTHPYRYFIPLPEMLGETVGTGPTSQAVDRLYRRLLSELGPELAILEHISLPDIARVGGPTVCDAIERMRSGKVHVEAGYDCVYGIIRAFGPGEIEREKSKGQKQLF